LTNDTAQRNENERGTQSRLFGNPCAEKRQQQDDAGTVTADTRGSTAYNYRYNKRGRLDRLTIGSTQAADYTDDEGVEK